MRAAAIEEAARRDVPARPAGERFPCFDGLRAVAALAVVLYHTTTNYNLLTSEHATWGWINLLGNFGVSTFFVISGFLLYRPFVLAHLRDRPAPALGAFWRRRFVRIFPAYWLAITALFFGFGFARLHSPSEFVTSYALIQNYRWGYQLFGLAVSWTLVIEVSFYVALPFLAMVLRALTPAGATIERKLRGQLATVAVLYAIAMLVRVWSLWFLHSSASLYGDWFPISQITFWLVSYLDWFALGMLLAVGSAWLACGGRLPWAGEELARHPGVCWALAGECYWVALQLHLPPGIYDRVTRVQSFGIAFVYGVVAFLLLFPAVFGPQDEGRIRRLLRSRPLTALGTISYGIYLWHLMLVKQVGRWTTSGVLPANLFVWLPVVAGLAIGAATLSYAVVERPLIRRSHGGPRRPLRRAGTTS